MVITVSENMEKEATSLQNMIPKCSIYRVPEYFLKGKEQCYRPLELSIGPVFYNEPKFATMQKFKWIFLKYFIKHPDNASQSVEPYMMFVSKHEDDIRECYQHEMELSLLSSDHFIQMIVLDAAFLIFYFLLEASLRSAIRRRPVCTTPRDRSVHNLGVAYEHARRDLFVEENQLPYFVLQGIYYIAFGHLNSCLPFTDLVLANIRFTTTTLPWHHAIKSNIDGDRITNALVGCDVNHLVHLLRECCLPFPQQQRDSQVAGDCHTFCKNLVHLFTKCCLPFDKQRRDSEDDSSHMFRSAKRLSDAGVRFKLNKNDDKFGITFDKSNGVLKVSKLTLDDNSEAFFRNILFFEQCWPNYRNKYFADLFCFLDDLIDTVEDIQILKKSQILVNELGSDEDAKDLFNNLVKNIIIFPNSTFSGVSKDLKDYSNTRWNKWKTILWSKYFNHPWAIISVIAAVILLILTVLQTTTGFLQLE